MTAFTMIFEQLFEQIRTNTWGESTLHNMGSTNMQTYRHKLNNTHEGAEQQDYYLPMTEEQGNNWLTIKGNVVELNNK
jgi:hypothetical protein